MAGILDTVDQRTQLVGENRPEILMFRLAGRQLFAINVFKVQKYCSYLKLTSCRNVIRLCVAWSICAARPCR